MMTNDPAKWPKELTVQQVTAGTAAGPPAYWLQLRDNPAAAEGKPVTLFYIHGEWHTALIALAAYGVTGHGVVAYGMARCGAVSFWCCVSISTCCMGC